MNTTPDAVTAFSSEAQGNAIFACSPVGICIARDAIILNANAALLAMFGYQDVSQIRGRSLVELVAPSARAAVAERARRRQQGEAVETVYETMGQRQDGSEFPYIVAVDRIQLADGVASVAFCTDISERKRAEDRLHYLAEASVILASSLEYQQTIRNVAAIIVPRLADWCSINLVAADGHIESLGIAHHDPGEQEALEQARADTPLPEDAPFGYALVIRTGQSQFIPNVSQEHLQVVDDLPGYARVLAELQPRSVICVPISARGEAIGALTIGISQSSQPYTHEDLALAEELGRRIGQAIDKGRLYTAAQEAIAQRDQFLMLAAHELRTPITAVLGYAQWLAQRLATSGQQGFEREQRSAAIIAAQSQRLHVLIETLLDVSRLAEERLTIERQPVDLRALVMQVVEEVQSVLQQHQVIADVPLSEVVVEGDALRLEQVMQNLVNNAIKYSPNGGVVRLQLSSTAHQAQVAISDQGIGIPKVAQEQLFTRFFRASNVAGMSGLGLGLQLSKDIVELHGGTISVASEEGHGSTFTIQLPLAAAP